MYTFNLLSLDATMNNKSQNDNNMPRTLYIEKCSIKQLKSQIAQMFSLSDNSFDVYCQGVQLIGDDKNLNDYDIENEDSLLIVPKAKLPSESALISSAGKIIYKHTGFDLIRTVCFINEHLGVPSKSELHQSSKTIEKSATPNEFHRLYWLMRTPEFWRRITQVLPEILLDSSALGLCEDSVLFCQNYNVKRLTEIVEANPLLYKAVMQVIKEWTSTSNINNSNDVQLSPAAYFLNGSPHLIEPVAPRQPALNVMPRRITNEDFYRALEQTSRSSTASRPSTIPVQPLPPPPSAAAAAAAAAAPLPPPPPRTSTRRNKISMDQLRSVLQRTATTSDSNTSTPITTMESIPSEPPNVQALLDQMYAMGLTDHAANRQALEAVNWDLKAAIDLLLG